MALLVPHTFLYYYDEGNLETPRGIIDMEFYTNLTVDPHNVISVSPQDGLSIRSFYFQSEHREDANFWVSSLLRERYASLKDERDAFVEVQENFTAQLEFSAQAIQQIEEEKEGISRSLQSELSRGNEDQKHLKQLLEDILKGKVGGNEEGDDQEGKEEEEDNCDEEERRRISSILSSCTSVQDYCSAISTATSSLLSSSSSSLSTLQEVVEEKEEEVEAIRGACREVKGVLREMEKTLEKREESLSALEFESKSNMNKLEVKQQEIGQLKLSLKTLANSKRSSGD